MIYVNGERRIQKSFQKFLCYVPSNSIPLPNLSLKETLMTAVNLKFNDVTREEKCKLVKDAIRYWGLTECENTLVRNLSDGEKKRLCIVQEIINKPSLIFLDEPTSGLDSLCCFQCISMLKDLANRGHTVICSIHQASAKVFEQFTKLYVLVEGQCLYDGLTNNLLTFLSSQNLECPLYHNPADFVIEIALGVNMTAEESLNMRNKLIAVNAEKYKCTETETLKEKSKHAFSLMKFMKNYKNDAVASDEIMCTSNLLKNNQSIIYEATPKYARNTWYQFLILLNRAVLSIMKEPFIIYFSSAVHIIIGILMGLMYYGIGNDASKIQDNTSCLLFTLVFIAFTSMEVTVLTFNNEMALIQQEIFNRWYNLKSYYLARTFADIPYNVIQPVVFGSIIYWMTGQINDIPRFCIFILICLFTSLICQSVGLCFGSIFKPQNALYLSASFIVPHILFCGFFIRFNVIPSYLKWTTYVSIFRYGFEGMLISTYSFNRTLLHCPTEYCIFQDPEYFLQEMGITHSLLYINLIVIISYFFILRIVAYFLLSLKIKYF
ncbi:ATP-binding cassette sub-family G member 4-like [Centruroides sculpturatus]|uniref:ATP-binding cassette sub-family G member 4-like n=1 Tax=Centruroides sculpturatus TaxID=218467 RepID=UPI000C6E7335|nr:ATP-binding cassette sub-family G member 4-like [Centruroides sculpturatus]